MKILIVLITYLCGVMIEYFLFLYPVYLSGTLIEYLFVFGIFVIPGLFLFVVPFSHCISIYSQINALKLCIVYILFGAFISFIMIFITFPKFFIKDIFHFEYIFVLLNGSWFSLVYLVMNEMVLIVFKKKAIQEVILDSQSFIRNHDMLRAK